MTDVLFPEKAEMRKEYRYQFKYWYQRRSQIVYIGASVKGGMVHSSMESKAESEEVSKISIQSMVLRVWGQGLQEI